MPQMEIEDAGLDMTDSVEGQEASVATINTGGTATIVRLTATTWLVPNMSW